MLLFAETLVAWDAAYITLLTQVDNEGMQNAAAAAGYFRINVADYNLWGHVSFAKALSPLLLDAAELRQRAAASALPYERRGFIDPFSF